MHRALCVLQTYFRIRLALKKWIFPRKKYFPKKLKNPPKKVAHNRHRPFFFLCSPTAQNSPEVHFRSINSPIHSSVLKSVIETLRQAKGFDTKKWAILQNFHFKIRKIWGNERFSFSENPGQRKIIFLDSIMQKLPVWRHLTVALALSYKSLSTCIWFLIRHNIMKILTGHLLFLS